MPKAKECKPRHPVKSYRKRPGIQADALSKPSSNFFNLEELLDRLGEALRPMGSRTYGVTLNRPLSDTYSRDFDRAIEAVKPLISNLGQCGVSTEAVWSILARFHSPLDRDTIQMEIDGLADAKKIIQQQITARRQLSRHFGFIKYPTIPSPLQEQLHQDNTKVIEILVRDKATVEAAERLVRSMRPALLPSKNPNVRQAERKLVHLLEKASIARADAAKFTLQLLRAWDPGRAPATTESILVRQSTRSS